MGFRGILKMSWMLIALLPLVFIVHVDGGHKKNHTASPYNTTQEKNTNYTFDYGMNYYEYPVELFLNETHNDTYGLGAYYNDYYPDYYGFYAYPELNAYYDQMDETTTENMTSTLKPKRKHVKGIKKPKAKRSRRETRSISEANVMKHLCMKNLLNVTNIFQYVRYIYECEDKEFKHFACITSNGFIKPCFILKEEKNKKVPLCIKKEIAPFVTTCSSPEPQIFCFTDPKEVNKIVICNDTMRRVCFTGDLTNCEKQEQMQLQSPFKIIRPKQKNHEKKREPRAIANPPKHKKGKPDVNCNNCEVDVKVIFDEMVDNAPKVLIKVSKLNPLDKLLDVLDSEFDS